MKRAFLCLAFLPALALAGPGFFSVGQKNGRWWLLDPQGKPFFCTAVNSVEKGASLQSLRSWGFNTIGGYSDLEFSKKSGWPFTIALVTGSLLGIPWVDPGSPESLRTLQSAAAEALKYRGDPNLIGYFIENETGWWDESMLTFWMTKASTERPKRELLKMLMAEYKGDLALLLKDFALAPLPSTWSDLGGKFTSVGFKEGRRPALLDQFVGWFADEYYSIVARELRKVDPDHMLLGDRYLSYYSPAVAKAAAKYMDVISTNYNTYSEAGWVSPAFFDGLYAATGKPIMVTEFYFSAMENSTGNPNSHGPFIIVKTQQERARGAAAMASTLASLPYVVGHHWFQFKDEPKKGRDDGEDFNFGLVDIEGRPYPLLTAALSASNHAAAKDHAAGGGFEAQTPGKLSRALNLKNDGYLGDWDLKAAWLGAAADFYAAWTPDGLWLALAFQDFDSREDLPSQQRLTLKVSRKGLTRNFRISDFLKDKPVGPRLIGGAPRFPPLKLEGDAPLKGSKASKEAVSVTTLSEIFLSKDDLGGAFTAGDQIVLEIKLKLKGTGREWIWNGPLTLN